MYSTSTNTHKFFICKYLAQLLLMLGFSLHSLGQSTTFTLTCIGSSGSYKSGSVNAVGTKNDGNLINLANAQNRGWATFDLSSIPINAPIVNAQLNFTTYSSNGSSGNKSIYGFTGNTSTMSGASLYPACASGNVLNSSTWQIDNLQSKILNTDGLNFIQSNEGSVVNFGFSNTNTNPSNIFNIYGYGANAPTLTITYNPPVCVSPLIPGNTISSVDSACSTNQFGLSLQNILTGIGITYQWQSATNSSFTSGVTSLGPNTSSITMNQNVARYYRCEVRCNGGTPYYSTPVYVPMTNVFYKCYCTTSPSIGSANDIITNVTMGTLNNTSTYSTNAPAYFTSYNNTPVNITSGTTQNISITVGNQAQQHTAVWIDLDQDGNFNSTEMLASSVTAAPGNATIMYSLAIPINANIGLTRMRVRGGSNNQYSSGGGACSSSQYGETEDYMVNIVGCSNPLNVGNTLASTDSVCSGKDFQLSLQYPPIGAGVTYEWQQAFNATFTPGYSILGTQSTLITSQTSARYYRCKVICSGGIAYYSNPIYIPMNNIFYNCYCYMVPVNSSTEDIITNVTMGTLDNTSTYSTNYPTYYTNYNNIPVKLIKGGTKNIAITFGNDPAQHSVVWIDFDQNGIFDTYEKLAYSTVATGANGTQTYTLSIPTNALTGLTKMRVRGGANSWYDLLHACYPAHGETEDYFVEIIESCALPSNLQSNNISCGATIVSCTSTVTPVYYKWRYKSTSATNWIYDSSITPSKTLLALLANTTYNLCVRTECVDSNYSAWECGTFTTDSCTTDPCTYGNALHFDGINDYVDLNSVANPLASSTNFTIEFWMKANYADNTASPRASMFAINPASPGENKFAILLGSGTGSVQTGKLSIYDPNSSPWYLTSDSIIGDNTCHHIAYVRTGNVGEAFIDGVSIGTHPAGSPLAATDRVSLGQEWDNLATSDFYHGQLDELRIWSVARTQAEISANMENIQSNEPGLIAYYKFDHGVANANNMGINYLEDVSSNNYNGSLLNFALQGNTSNWTYSCGDLATASDTFSIYHCDNYYQWSLNLQYYYMSGLYSHTTTTANGCDSIVVLDLTLQYPTNTTTIATACDSYEWNVDLNTYSYSGVYFHYWFDPITSCTNTDILYLTIVPYNEIILSETACDSFYWSINGLWYSTNGTYTQIVGCDKYILSLTIYPSTISIDSVIACDEYLWTANGMFYTNSGVYTHSSLNSNNCPHEDVLYLTIHPTLHNRDTAQDCQTYAWGVCSPPCILSTSGIYTHIGTNPSTGCLVYDTLDLTIVPNPCTANNVLNISTGIDEIGNLLFTGYPDPKWKLFHNLNLPIHPFNSAIITYHNGWGSSSNSRFISYGPSPGYATSDTTTGFYNFKFKRPFSTCTDDTLTFNLNLMYDNYLNGIYVDGILVPNTFTTNNTQHYLNFENFNFIKFLAGGNHELEINIVNFVPFNSSNNPHGLNVNGTISGTYTTLVQNNSSPSCCCNPCPIPSGIAINATTNAATVSWNVIATATAYEYKLTKLSNNSVSSGSSNNNTVTFTSLQPCTMYEFCVRVPCANNTFSNWVCDTFTTTGITHSKIDTAICTAYFWASTNTIYTVSGSYTNIDTNANGCPKYDTLVLQIIGNVNIPACPLNDSTACYITGDSTASCTDSVHLMANAYSNIHSTTQYVVTPKTCENCHNWVGSHPVIVNIDDTWSNVINMPFEFCFFGNKYDKFIIGANGQVSFNVGLANTFNQWSSATWTAPYNHSSMNNCIMSPFHDIDPGIPYAGKRISWEVYGTAPCRYMIVSWDSIPMFACNSLLASQQIVLYESSNIIDINIKNKPLCASWNQGAAHQGIQNANGTVAYMVPGRNGGQWTAANDCYRFTPSAPSNFLYEWKDALTGNILANTAQLNYLPTSNSKVLLSCKLLNACDTIVMNHADSILTLVNTPNINISASHSCNGGISVINYSVSGGVNPYTVSYQMPSPGNTMTGIIVNNTIYAPIAPHLGTYTITVCDANGCCATKTITVTILSSPPAIGLHLDGVNDFVSIPNAPSLNFNTNNFTCEMWVKLGLNSTNNMIISKRSTNAIFPDGFMIFTYPTQLYVQTNNAGNPFPGNHGPYGSAINDNIWHHVALTRSGNLFTIYLDGTNVGSFTSAVNISSPGPLLLGKDNPDNSYMNGSLDEVRLWSVARTQAEINDNMYCEISNNANLIAYYKLNAGIANANNAGLIGVTDHTGHGHCGTLMNAALLGTTSNYVVGKVTNCCLPTTSLAEICYNGIDENCNGLIDENCPPIWWNVHCLIQGYYIGNLSMASVLMNQGVSNDPLLADSITINLHDPLPPYGLMYNYTGILQTDGLVNCALPLSTVGNSYYIVIKHRNAIETWSANPVTISASTNYDFTTAANKAYGSNQIEVEPGVWALYSGELNKDDNIDLLDIISLESDIDLFLSGYYATDINGDGNVDLLDGPVTEINASNFIFAARP